MPSFLLVSYILAGTSRFGGVHLAFKTAIPVGIRYGTVDSSPMPRYPFCSYAAVVRAMVVAGKVRTTVSALAGGAALGFGFEEIVGAVAALTPRDFYKSITTHADHRVWQDVYRPETPVGEVYLKLTGLDDLPIVSFKEL